MSMRSGRLWWWMGVTVAFGNVPASHAAEGMWTLDNLPMAALKAQYQFEPSTAWINKAMRASVRLAQGCSGSFVSPGGLVLTNHHCVSNCVEGVSTTQQDYVQPGFLAQTRDQELRCPALELNQLEQITDVTAQIKVATAGKTGAAFTPALNAAIARLTGDCVGQQRDVMRCDVVKLYRGGRYHLYRYHRYQDVRLVWVPEFAAAFFGGDPDNFNFPRYALDAALLRAYENGKPVASRDYFAIKPQGAAPGELTFTLGHPGSTMRELTVAQLETLRDVRVPRTLVMNAELRGLLGQYQQSNADAAHAAHGDFFGVENSFKAYRGMQLALLDPALLTHKREQEAALQRYVATHPEQHAAKNAWRDIEQAQQTARLIADRHYFLEAGRGFQSRYVSMARTLVRGAAERAKADAERLPEFTEAALPAIEQGLFSSAPLYPDYEQTKLAWSLTKLREWLGVDDPLVRAVLGKESPEQVAARVVAQSSLADVSVRRDLWAHPDKVATHNDPALQLARVVDEAARAVRSRYENEVESVEQRAGQAIAEARFAMTGTGVYPDATFTLRLSFGDVRGWQKGEQQVAPFTTFGGAFERHTGADPFALPASWLAARNRPSNGLNPAVPLNFTSTNDIVGGNSGSPVINRKGELVGLIFDGNLPSLGGAFGFDEQLNRAVSVHAGGIVEALRHVYGASMLVKELGVK